MSCLGIDVQTLHFATKHHQQAKHHQHQNKRSRNRNTPHHQSTTETQQLLLACRRRLHPYINLLPCQRQFHSLILYINTSIIMSLLRNIFISSFICGSMMVFLDIPTTTNGFFVVVNVNTKTTRTNIIKSTTDSSTLLFAIPRYGPPLSSSSPLPSEYNSNNNSTNTIEEDTKNTNKSETTSSKGKGFGGNINVEEQQPQSSVSSEWKIRMEEQQNKFRTLIEEVMSITQPEHLPRLLANNMDLVMSLQGEEGTQVITTLLDEAKQRDKEMNGNDNDDGNDDDDEGGTMYLQTLQSVDIVLSFAEDFVQQALEMDDNNKKLLGKIIMAMRKPDNNNNNNSDSDDIDNISGIVDVSTPPLTSQEDILDQLLEQEKDSFTPGFLRHIEGECERIQNAPKMSRESARLLEILRIIQTRVLEEIGKEMGEATLVLGQLMGYDNDDELLGVLDAGLTVRGRDFANEMSNLTQEALDGFKRVPGGVDPDLIERVSLIDQRLKDYLDETNEFQ